MLAGEVVELHGRAVSRSMQTIPFSRFIQMIYVVDSLSRFPSVHRSGVPQRCLRSANVRASRDARRGEEVMTKKRKAKKRKRREERRSEDRREEDAGADHCELPRPPRRRAGPPGARALGVPAPAPGCRGGGDTMVAMSGTIVGPGHA